MSTNKQQKEVSLKATSSQQRRRDASGEQAIKSQVVPSSNQKAAIQVRNAQHEQQQHKSFMLSPQPNVGNQPQVHLSSVNSLAAPSSQQQQQQRRKSTLSANGFFIDYSCTRRRSSARAAQQTDPLQQAIQRNQFLRNVISPTRRPSCMVTGAMSTTTTGRRSFSSSSTAAAFAQQQQEFNSNSNSTRTTSRSSYSSSAATATSAGCCTVKPIIPGATLFASSRRTSMFDPAGHSLAAAAAARRTSALMGPTCSGSGGASVVAQLAPAVEQVATMRAVSRQAAALQQAESKGGKRELVGRVPVIGCSPTSIRASLAALDETRRYEKLLHKLRKHQKRKEKERARRQRDELELDPIDLQLFMCDDDLYEERRDSASGSSDCQSDCQESDKRIGGGGGVRRKSIALLLSGTQKLMQATAGRVSGAHGRDSAASVEYDSVAAARRRQRRKSLMNKFKRRQCPDALVDGLSISSTLSFVSDHSSSLPSIDHILNELYDDDDDDEEDEEDDDEIALSDCSSRPNADWLQQASSTDDDTGHLEGYFSDEATKVVPSSGRARPFGSSCNIRRELNNNELEQEDKSEPFANTRRLRQRRRRRRLTETDQPMLARNTSSAKCDSSVMVADACRDSVADTKKSLVRKAMKKIAHKLGGGGSASSKDRCVQLADKVPAELRQRSKSERLRVQSGSGRRQHRSRSRRRRSMSLLGGLNYWHYYYYLRDNSLDALDTTLLASDRMARASFAASACQLGAAAAAASDGDNDADVVASGAQVSADQVGATAGAGGQSAPMSESERRSRLYVNYSLARLEILNCKWDPVERLAERMAREAANSSFGHEHHPASASDHFERDASSDDVSLALSTSSTSVDSTSTSRNSASLSSRASTVSSMSSSSSSFAINQLGAQDNVQARSSSTSPTPNGTSWPPERPIQQSVSSQSIVHNNNASNNLHDAQLASQSMRASGLASAQVVACKGTNACNGATEHRQRWNNNTPNRSEMIAATQVIRNDNVVHNDDSSCQRFARLSNSPPPFDERHIQQQRFISSSSTTSLASSMAARLQTNNKYDDDFRVRRQLERDAHFRFSVRSHRTSSAQITNASQSPVNNNTQQQQQQQRQQQQQQQKLNVRSFRTSDTHLNSTATSPKLLPTIVCATDSRPQVGRVSSLSPAAFAKEPLASSRFAGGEHPLNRRSFRQPKRSFASSGGSSPSWIQTHFISPSRSSFFGFGRKASSSSSAASASCSQAVNKSTKQDTSVTTCAQLNDSERAAADKLLEQFEAQMSEAAGLAAAAASAANATPHSSHKSDRRLQPRPSTCSSSAATSVQNLRSTQLSGGGGRKSSASSASSAASSTNHMPASKLSSQSCQQRVGAAAIVRTAGGGCDSENANAPSEQQYETRPTSSSLQVPMSSNTQQQPQANNTLKGAHCFSATTTASSRHSRCATISNEANHHHQQVTQQYDLNANLIMNNSQQQPAADSHCDKVCARGNSSTALAFNYQLTSDEIVSRRFIVPSQPASSEFVRARAHSTGARPHAAAAAAASESHATYASDHAMRSSNPVKRPPPVVAKNTKTSSKRIDDNEINDIDTDEDDDDNLHARAINLLGKSSFVCTVLGARQTGKRSIVLCFVKLLNEFKLAADEYKKEKMLTKLVECSERLHELTSREEQRLEQQLQTSHEASQQQQHHHGHRRTSRLNSWLPGSAAVKSLLNLSPVGKRRLHSMANLWSGAAGTTQQQQQQPSLVTPATCEAAEIEVSDSTAPHIAQRRHTTITPLYQQRTTEHHHQQTSTPTNQSPTQASRFLSVGDHSSSSHNTNQQHNNLNHQQQMNKSDTNINYHQNNNTNTSGIKIVASTNQLQVPGHEAAMLRKHSDPTSLRTASQRKRHSSQSPSSVFTSNDYDADGDNNQQHLVRANNARRNTTSVPASSDHFLLGEQNKTHRLSSTCHNNKQLDNKLIERRGRRRRRSTICLTKRRKRLLLSLKEMNRRKFAIRFNSRKQISDTYLELAEKIAIKNNDDDDNEENRNSCSGQNTTGDDVNQLSSATKRRRSIFKRLTQQASLAPDAFLVVYSINDRDSFNYARSLIERLRKVCTGEIPLPIVLVANKSDLERNREVKNEDGRLLAKQFACKFIEISCTIGFNLDNLLVGLRTQLVLKHHIVLSSILRPGVTYKSNRRSSKVAARKQQLETHSRRAVNKKSACDNIIVRFYKRYVMDNHSLNYECDNFSKL